MIALSAFERDTTFEYKGEWINLSDINCICGYSYILTLTTMKIVCKWYLYFRVNKNIQGLSITDSATLIHLCKWMNAPKLGLHLRIGVDARITVNQSWAYVSCLLGQAKLNQVDILRMVRSRTLYRYIKVLVRLIGWHSHSARAFRVWALAAWGHRGSPKYWILARE